MTGGDLDAAGWALLERLFAEIESVEEADRAAWIDENCSDDQVRATLERMLEADRRVSGESTGMYPDSAIVRDWLDETSADDSAEQAGKVGPYILDREIGRGATSRVFMATREKLGGRVALKLLRHDPIIAPESLRRFEFEHRLLARLEHPNIAHLLDAGVSKRGTAYLAMEYVEGQPITDYCRTLDVQTLLELFLQVCEAVAHAHRRGIIHRDLKPGNILVSRRGSVKLLDFGIGKLLEDEEDMPRTRTNMRLMTPQYAAPEVMLGEEVTTLSDVYSLGVVLYELLTGQRPFANADKNLRQLEDAVTTEVPVNPSTLVKVASRRSVRGDLDAIVLRALRREPERRYAGVIALADDIRRFLSGQPVEARGGTGFYRAHKFVMRNRWPLAVAALVLVLGMAYLSREITLRREAEAALATSEQVSEFLVSLFTVSDPGEARGESLTAREILDAGADRIEDSLTAQPEVQIRLMQTIGSVYRAMGLYEEATRLLEDALVKAVVNYGETDVRIATIKADLAYLYILDGSNFERSDQLGEQALAIYRTVYGDRSQEVVLQLNQMAFGLLKSQRNSERAVALLREALGIQQGLEQADDPDIANTLYHLGWANAQQGDLESARSLYEQALALRRKAYGATHPSLGWSLNNLGHLEIQLGHPGKAKAYCEEALEVNRRLFDGLHNEQGFNLRCISMAEQAMGNLKAALLASEDSIRILRATLPANSPELASNLGVLADNLASLGRYDDAVSVQKEAVEVFRSSGAASQERLDRALSRLASLQMLAGDAATP